jgi:hypothetical protein
MRIVSTGTSCTDRLTNNVALELSVRSSDVLATPVGLTRRIFRAASL